MDGYCRKCPNKRLSSKFCPDCGEPATPLPKCPKCDHTDHGCRPCLEGISSGRFGRGDVEECRCVGVIREDLVSKDPASLSSVLKSWTRIVNGEVRAGECERRVEDAGPAEKL